MVVVPRSLASFGSQRLNEVLLLLVMAELPGTVVRWRTHVRIHSAAREHFERLLGDQELQYLLYYKGIKGMELKKALMEERPLDLVLMQLINCMASVLVERQLG